MLVLVWFGQRCEDYRRFFFPELNPRNVFRCLFVCCVGAVIWSVRTTTILIMLSLRQHRRQLTYRTTSFCSRSRPSSVLAQIMSSARGILFPKPLRRESENSTLDLAEPRESLFSNLLVQNVARLRQPSNRVDTPQLSPKVSSQRARNFNSQKANRCIASNVEVTNHPKEQTPW